MYAWIDMAQPGIERVIVKDEKILQQFFDERKLCKDPDGWYVIVPDLPEFEGFEGGLEEFVINYSLHHTFAPSQNEVRSCGMYKSGSARATLDYDGRVWQLRMVIHDITDGELLYRAIRTSEATPEESWGVPLVR